ncbi:MAG: sigma-54-dependent Fis family transcriptional regulator [Fibrobacteria bacterium]|nr:sigma-54-dependent Fis family transcriptional regulator [Fibrobacteria bacterium]
MQPVLHAPDSSFAALLRQIRAVARLDSTVLLLGESGTGKEVCARTLHEQSRRGSAVFVALNCAAIPPTLLESELFGHERGAFTGAHAQRAGRFEQADGGTLFLDEVGELSLTAQASLLRVLQERRVCRVGGSEEIDVDFRLVAATHRDLWGMVQAGTFRQDLYFRLHVVALRVPPLRERIADIPFLAKGLLSRVSTRLREPAPRLEPGALQELMRYDWPGNVRELENLMERFVALHPLGMDLRELVEESRRRQQRPPEDPLQRERKSLQELLERHGGHRSRAAAELGISRRALTYRLQRTGLTRVRG